MTAQNQDFEVSQGDTFTLQIPILHSDGSPVVLASPQGDWVLSQLDFPLEGDVPILLKGPSTGGITLAQNQSNVWVMTVSFTAADTLNISAGNHYHEARVSDGATSRTVAVGIMTILPTIARESYGQ